MKKLWQFLDNYLLKIGVSFVLAFIALYPKLPSISITHTWVYIRLEDFLIGIVVIIWIVQLLRKKISLPFPLGLPIVLYWIIGFCSLIFSLLFIGPHLANFFPKIAALEYVRRIEYMILFFVGFASVKTKKDVRDYLIVLGATLFGILLYGFGQRFYLSFWTEFPSFARQFPFCFPSFQTGNEEFAKGIPLCLPQDARITSTFGGHYDLAAYLVVVIPIFIGICIVVKNIKARIAAGLLSISSIMLLIFTASRVSFAAYLIGTSIMLIFLRQKKYILPIFFVSILVLMVFSASLEKRFLETFRLTSIVTNNQGQIIGEAQSTLPADLQNKVASNAAIEENIPSQSLPAGTFTTVVPFGQKPTTTKVAVVKTSLTSEQIKQLKLKNGGIEISTVSGNFLVQKALVYDISFTTRFQGEWPHAWAAFMRNPPLGSGYSSITLASDNDYLRLLGESGFLGFASFFFIFIFFGIYVKETMPNIKNTGERAFIYGLVGGVMGLCINASLIDVFEASKVAESLWLLLGIGAGTLFLYPTKTIDYAGDLKKIFTSKIFLSFYFLIIVGIVFLPSINNFFVSTDFTLLHSAASSTVTTIKKDFMHPQSIFYHPLAEFVLYFLYTFFSFLPQGYHLFALLIHFAMTLGVYLLALRLFKKKSIAFVAGLLFLLLPSHGENIFWFSTIATNLASVCILFCMLSYIKFRTTHKWYSYGISLVLSLLAFLSHEIAIIIPFLIITSELFGLPSTKKITKNFLLVIPYFVIFFVYIVFRSLTTQLLSTAIPLHFMNIFGNCFSYIGLFIFNSPIVSPMQFIIAAVFIILFVVLIIFVLTGMHGFSKKPSLHPLFFASFLMLISLIPVLTYPNIGSHFAYISSVGFVIGICYLLYITQLCFEKNKMLGTILLFVFVGIIASIYIKQLTQENIRWNTAGNTTYHALSVFRIDYEDVPKNTTLFFVNTPLYIDGTPVFDTGLTDGLWFIYRDSTLTVRTPLSLEQAKNDASVINMTTFNKTYIFKLDEKGNVEEIK